MKKLIVTFAVLFAFQLANTNYSQGQSCAPGCKGRLQSCLSPYGIHVYGNSSTGISVILSAGTKGTGDNTTAILACIDDYNVCKVGCPSAPTLFVTTPPMTNAQAL